MSQKCIFESRKLGFKQLEDPIATQNPSKIHFTTVWANLDTKKKIL